MSLLYLNQGCQVFKVGWPGPFCTAADMHEHLWSLAGIHATDSLPDEAWPCAIQGPGVHATEKVQRHWEAVNVHASQILHGKRVLHFFVSLWEWVHKAQFYDNFKEEKEDFTCIRNNNGAEILYHLWRNNIVFRKKKNCMPQSEVLSGIA